MLESLFGASDFVPRRLCGLWTPVLLTIHMTSDLIIFASYMIIALQCFHMFTLWQKRRINLPLAAHFAPVLAVVFGMFILLCGCTHLNQVIVFYWPWYRFLGIWSAMTASVSFLAVMTLWKAIRLCGLPEAEVAP